METDIAESDQTQALIDELKLIEEQPITERAESYEALHDRLGRALNVNADS